MAQKGYFKIIQGDSILSGQSVKIPKLRIKDLEDVERGMLVLLPKICPTCEGKGEIVHPDWLLFYARGVRKNLPKQLKEAKKYWKKKGKANQKSWPPQEIECVACMGNKYTYSWGIFDLQTLLTAWTNTLNNIGKDKGFKVGHI